MKKRVFLIVLTVMCALVCFLLACGGEKEHIFADGWTIDDTSHWHACTVSGCAEKKDNAAHSFTNGTCVCGKTQVFAHTHTLARSAAVAATCTTNGKTEYWVCRVCDKKFSDNSGKTEITNVAITATGHSFSTAWTYDDNKHWYAATCEHTTEKKDAAIHTFTNGQCSVCGAKAATSGLNYTQNSNGNSYTCTGIGTATDSDVVIPSTYNGKPVTGIGIEAFKGCDKITSITIPSSVTSIGDYAFSGCPIESATIPAIAASYIRNSNLKTVVITSGTSIGVYAFRGCSELMSITIPDSVTSIDGGAFKDCSSLTSITISNSVKSIGNQAFSGCSSLTSITIGNSVTSIDYRAFYDCGILTSITIPNSVTSIGNYAFYFCSALTIYCEKATKPSGWSVSEYGSWNSSCPVVWDCKNNNKDKDGYEYSVIDGIRYSLKDGVTTVVGQPRNITTITIPSSVTYKGSSYSVTSIGSSAFYGCSSLTSITIPSSVTSIGSYAFSWCKSLTRITIPNSVTRISNSAFEDCNSLTSVTIGNSVTSIDGTAFNGCSSLESIKVASGNTKYHSSGNCIIETATKTLIAGCKNSIIPTDGSVTSIGMNAFLNYSSLTSITIPSSVTSIGSGAFRDCSSLTSITIPNSVTSIGMNAFYNCRSLTSITIPSSVTSIGSGAFEGCSSLESIKVASGNTKYHSSGNCIIATATKTLILGCKNSVIPTDGSVTSIGYMAFSGCSSLTSITIPSSVTSIGEYAFYDCRGLTSITFKGTKAQWNVITKGSNWNYDTGNYVVHCTDGNIAKG